MSDVPYTGSLILAPPGNGKTQLLEYLVVERIKQGAVVIFVDSRQQAIPRFARMKCFAGNDRLIYLSPDMGRGYSPALNMFAPKKRSYQGTLAEALEASTLQSFQFIFETLLADTSARQDTALSYMIRLMLSIPGATIHTLLELLEDGINAKEPSMAQSTFYNHIMKLDDMTRRFFETYFFARSFSNTRKALSERLLNLLRIPRFRAMFTAKHNAVDWFDIVQTPGKVVLVDTDVFLLKRDASAVFGKYVISGIINAVLERITIKDERKWRPVYLFIDEGSEYFAGQNDTSLTEILLQCRKYKLAAHVATQNWSQFGSEQTRAAVLSTGTKWVAGLPTSDAAILAREMRTTPDRLMSTKLVHRKSAEWMRYVAGDPKAVKLTLPLGALDQEPVMTDFEYEVMMDRMRRDYCALPTVVAPTKPAADDAAW